ncbi:hypothetical protein FISHEDRAFT_57508 [Fistulina hepatica ATCC 64428]|uniref:Uncharacterized protein n=1 Tax=Fistulina hepatica ATCC 64428 TaxID=1128425 RepID=A0A0D7AIJ8_9AGAR|nr:hypothetical protein FISHEDRAFT_57508 [Fistulina hepatica ATCC 64428]
MYSLVSFASTWVGIVRALATIQILGVDSTLHYHDHACDCKGAQIRPVEDGLACMSSRAANAIATRAMGYTFNVVIMVRHDVLAFTIAAATEVTEEHAIVLFPELSDWPLLPLLTNTSRSEIGLTLLESAFTRPLSSSTLRTRDSNCSSFEIEANKSPTEFFTICNKVLASAEEHGERTGEKGIVLCLRERMEGGGHAVVFLALFDRRNRLLSTIKLIFAKLHKGDYFFDGQGVIFREAEARYLTGSMGQTADLTRGIRGRCTPRGHPLVRSIVGTGIFMEQEMSVFDRDPGISTAVMTFGSTNFPNQYFLPLMRIPYAYPSLMWYPFIWLFRAGISGFVAHYHVTASHDSHLTRSLAFMRPHLSVLTATAHFQRLTLLSLVGYPLSSLNASSAKPPLLSADVAGEGHIQSYNASILPVLLYDV